MESFINIYKKERDYVQYLLIFLVAVAAAWFVFVSSVPVCVVSGYSMLPTVDHKDVVLLSPKSSYSRGEIIVFDNNGYSANPKVAALIKRVVGAPGDVLDFRKETIGSAVKLRLYVQEGGEGEFIKQQEDFLGEPMDNAETVKNAQKVSVPVGTPFEIPDGYYYVMGDNRNNSGDSRGFGAVKAADITGAYFFRAGEGSFADFLLNILYFGRLHEAGDGNGA